MADLKRESYVALFDMLGFAAMIDGTPLQEMVDRLQYLEAIAGTENIESIVFSDTVLLYTRGTGPYQLHELLDHCCALIAACNTNGILLRGGITRGAFYHDKQIFLGKAMVQAFRLEQSQDWMGGILDPSIAYELKRSADAEEQGAWQRIRDERLLIQYSAPIKGGPVGPLWCLGWPKYGDKDRPRPHKINWDVLRKLANTDAFAEHYERGD